MVRYGIKKADDPYIESELVNFVISANQQYQLREIEDIELQDIKNTFNCLYHLWLTLKDRLGEEHKQTKSIRREFIGSIIKELLEPGRSVISILKIVSLTIRGYSLFKGEEYNLLLQEILIKLHEELGRRGLKLNEGELNAKIISHDVRELIEKILPYFFYARMAKANEDTIEKLVTRLKK